MNRVSCWVLGLVLGLLLTARAGAQDKPKPPVPPDRPPGFGPPTIGLPAPLLPPQLAEKLDLTTEQKEKIDKLLKEHADKQKEAMAKVREAMEKAKGDQEALRKAGEQFRELLQGGGKARQEAEAQLKEILTKEQAKKYDELKKEYAPPGPGGVGPGFPPGPGGGFHFSPVMVIPGPLQQMLKVTPEQKEKLDKIQKEAEGKVMEVLTDEQKKQLEELKKRFQPAGEGPVPPPLPPPPPPERK